MISLISKLVENGFERYEYSDQIGRPIFYKKDFEEKDIPEFMPVFNADNPDSSAGVVTLELSEDGEILQYSCSGTEYHEVINPREAPQSALEMLSRFGLEQVEQWIIK